MSGLEVLHQFFRPKKVRDKKLTNGKTPMVARHIRRSPCGGSVEFVTTGGELRKLDLP